MWFKTIISVILSVITINLWRLWTYWSGQVITGPTLYELTILRFKIPIHEYTVQMNRKYGKMYRGLPFPDRTLIINDVDAIPQIFVTKFEYFPSRHNWNLGKSILAKMLIAIRGGEDWKRIHSILSPGFSSSKLKAMMSQIIVFCDKLAENLEPIEKTGNVVDMTTYFGAFTMDVISACAFGIEIDSLNNTNHPVVVNAKNVFSKNLTLSKGIALLAPKLARIFKIELFPNSFCQYFCELTEHIIAERKQNINKSEKPKDLLQLMIDSNEEEIDSKRRLSTEEMTAQIITFFFAAYDTTTITLSHAIYYLSANKECQQRVYSELNEVKEFSYDNLTELKYLCAVIDETLRLAPPLIIVPRLCVKDCEISGIKIPAGMTIETHPYVLHTEPSLWSDPMEFKPERFLEPKHNPWAYMPFGAGPRICIGKRFALNQIRMCLAKLLYKFEFTLAPGFNKMEYFNGNISHIPKSTLVTIKKRE